MVTIKINVTETDIREGEPRVCAKCPVSRAISRRLRKPYTASVSSSMILIVNDVSGAYITSLDIPTPTTVSDFIVDFDTCVFKDAKFPGPMSFDLELPRKYLRHHVR